MKIKRLILTMAVAALATVFMGCDDSSNDFSKDHSSSPATTVLATTEPTTISQKSAKMHAIDYVSDSIHNSSIVGKKRATWFDLTDVEYLGITTGTLPPQEGKSCYKFLITGEWGSELNQKTGDGSKFRVTMEVPVDGSAFYAAAVSDGY